MKRIFILAIIFSSFSMGTYAQGEMDAFNLSYNDLTGTARSVAMGGAFGALGGDISGVAINPAGIGVYQSSEIVTTLNFTNNRTQTNLFGSKTDDSKFKFTFDNLAFVGSVPLNSDVAPRLNLGFSYNRLKSFDRSISLRGNNLNNSLTDYIAYLGNESGYNNITGTDPYNNPNVNWLAELGYQGGVIKANNQNKFESAMPGQINNNLYMREQGDISSYDFNIGTTFSDMLSIGATVAVTDINYYMYSDYKEQMVGDATNYFLTNELSTEGSGWQVKVGAIFKPVEQLRIGVSYHSPTWYKMTDYYIGTIDAFGTKIANTPGDAYTDYEFRTPDKWTFSLAGVIGQRAIISADYELTNYGSMHLADVNGMSYTKDNGYIKSDFRNSSTVRVGAEVRFTPQFSGRIGYMWQQSPVEPSFKSSNADITNPDAEKVVTDRTVPQYTLVGDANYFTYGLGYKFTPNFYTDVAFVIKSRTDDLYTYTASDKAELKTNLFSGILTLGYKF